MELEKTGFNLEGRVLCSDESCIGVIGTDGRCKVCGKPYEGPEPIPQREKSSAGPSSPSAEPPGGEQSAPGEVVLDDDEAGERSPSERECCPDEACIGVIGPDGRCGVCGRHR
jgi:hypothetical protein